MNKRDEAIFSWVAANRRDLISQMRHILLDGDTCEPTVAAKRLLLSIGFEAGRRFQAENPDLELNNPNVYLGD